MRPISLTVVTTLGASALLLIGAAVAFKIFTLDIRGSGSIGSAGVIFRLAPTVILTLMAAATAAAAKMRTNYQQQLLLLYLTVAISIVAADYVLAKGVTDATATTHLIEARNKGIEFDERSPFQVVRDLRDQGTDAVPWISSGAFFGGILSIDGETIIPLQAVPLAHTVFCNENGAYTQYFSDRYGFNNQDSVWDAPEAIDTIFLGDSYVHGACVEPGESFTDVVRASGERVLNLGTASQGPLRQLGTLREYASGMRPNQIVWFYAEVNDLSDMKNEFGNSIVARYMEDDFSQGLAEKSSAVGALIRDHVDNLVLLDEPPETPEKSGPSVLNKALDAIRLKSIRQRVSDRVDDSDETAFGPVTQETRPSFDLLGNFSRVVDKVNHEARSLGSELLFVYIPEYESIVGGTSPPRNTQHDVVLEIIEEVGVPILDLTTVLSRRSKPEKQWALGIRGHFSPEGNRVIADAVLPFITPK